MHKHIWPKARPRATIRNNCTDKCGISASSPNIAKLLHMFVFNLTITMVPEKNVKIDNKSLSYKYKTEKEKEISQLQIQLQLQIETQNANHIFS